MPGLRWAILSVVLLPYLYYGGKDQVFHFVGRKVSLAEHLLHLLIGGAMAAAIACAFRARAIAFVVGLSLFLVFGAIDEYIYHRGLPEHESDLHAKGHMALLLFVVVAVAAQWFAGRPWAASIGLSG